MSPTRKQIEGATTKGLQDFYLQMIGKSTTNRNAKALRSRLLGLLVEYKTLEGVVPVTQPQTIATDVPADKGERKKAIETSAQKVREKVETKSPAEEVLGVGSGGTGFRGTLIAVDDPISVEQSYSDLYRQRSIRWWDKTMSNRISDPRTPRLNRKPKGPNSHEDSETRRLFAALAQGQVLSHRFRGSDGKTFIAECTVVQPPGLDGKGGKYRYNRKIYDTAREVIDAMGAPKWNPSLFFKLRPYWPHKQRDTKGVQ